MSEDAPQFDPLDPPEVHTEGSSEASVQIPVSSGDETVVADQQTTEEQRPLSPEDEAINKDLLARRVIASDVYEEAKAGEKRLSEQYVAPGAYPPSPGDFMALQGRGLEAHDSAVRDAKEHVEEHLPEYIETAKHEAEVDGVHINLVGDEMVQETTTTDEPTEINGDTTNEVENRQTDKESYDDPEIAEYMANAEKEMQEQVLNIKNSLLSQDLKDVAIKRLLDEGTRLADEAKNERLQMREQFQLATDNILGKFLDFSISQSEKHLTLLNTNSIDVGLIREGRDEELVALSYSLLGLEAPTKEEIEEAGQTIYITKETNKYRVVYIKDDSAYETRYITIQLSRK